ncbi:MAG: hypothetical protein QXV17_07945 [Candidatus Micrarchaeaceae archaeon]
MEAILQQELIEKILAEVADKMSEDQLSKDFILFCLENAIRHEVEMLTKKKVYIKWAENYQPLVYTIDNKEFSLELLNKHQFSNISNLFKKYLYKSVYDYQTVKLRNKYFHKIVKGKILAIKKNQCEIEIKENVKGIMRRDYYGIIEKELYRNDLTLYFYVINFTQDIDGMPCLELSRISKKLPERLLMAQLRKSISIVKHKRVIPKVVCTQRVPNKYCVISSNIMIPKRILDNTKKLLYGESVYVFPLQTKNSKVQLSAT